MLDFSPIIRYNESMKNKEKDKIKKYRSLGYYPPKRKQIESYNNLRNILVSDKSNVKKTLSKIHELIVSIPQDERIAISNLSLGYVQNEVNLYKLKGHMVYKK